MTSVMPRRQQPKLTPEQRAAQKQAAIAAAQAARPVANKVLEKAKAFVILDHPFFSTILMRHPLIERFDIPTIAVTARGTIYYNPAFIAGLTNEQAVGALCHEVLHYASGHALRRGDRNPQRWNYATDAWINDTLNNSGIPIQIPGIVNMPGARQRTEEQIYAELPDDEGDGPGDEPDDGGGGGGGGGGGQQSSDDNPMDGDLDPEDDGNMSEAERQEIDANRIIEVAEAASVAKMRGKLPGALAEFAAATVESRTPWYDILENYMTERVKNDYSWARPNRRYAPDFYLPHVDGVGAMGEIVIQVDISGSISRQEIKHYNGHMKRIVEQCKPTKVHVIYTDTEVQKHEEFDKPEDVEIQFYSGGGTDMRAGFEFIEKQGIEPEVVVTLTDGYTPFPDKDTSVPSIWCISTKDIQSPTGVNVHFDMND